MFYNLMLILGLPLTLPFIGLLLILRPEYRLGLLERLGFHSGEGFKPKAGRTRVWVHAASVGEYRAILPLIELWQREHPEWDLLLSVMTATARRLARAEGHPRAFFVPLDLPGIPSRVMRRLVPDAVVLVETELWPNLLAAASRRKIPVILVNGRVSPGSYPRYRLFRAFLGGVLRSIESFGMQTEEDAERMMALGAPPEKVRVTGNLKFDRPPALLSETRRRQLYEFLNWGESDPILIAGSTHDGEEDDLLIILEELRARWPSLRMILAPRHPERIPLVVSLIERRGRSYARYSGLGPKVGGPPADLMVVDIMGALENLYGLGTIAFVGGSLRPAGGHNLLEPALQGKPVLFGPYTDHIREMADLLGSSGGGRMVNDRTDLARWVNNLLMDPDRRRKMGELAREAAERLKGAARKTSRMVEHSLARRPLDRIRRLDFRPLHERWFDNRLVRSEGGLVTVLIGIVLRMFSAVYRAGQEIRTAAYSRGLVRSFRPGIPVISVGNLTFGGTGKTPAVIFLCERLIKRGHRPAVLSRGYGGKSGVAVSVVPPETAASGNWATYGDEPCLLAQRLPDLPVLVGRNRAKAAQWAVERLGTRLVILDDGYQHLRLHRDLNLLVVDFHQPFGNGFLLPRGTLRESVRQLRRADAVILNHVEDPAQTLPLQKNIRRYRRDVPIFCARVRPTRLANLGTGETVGIDRMKGNRLLAVAGIGRPDRFLGLLNEIGIEVAAVCIFRDHCPYRVRQLDRLEEEARRLGGVAIVTTEKDAVRLKGIGSPLPNWWSVQIEMVLHDESGLDSLLSGVLQ